MTLSQVTELLDYWRAHPPLHLLLASAPTFRKTVREGTIDCH
jgi:hypothetical protein